MLFPTLGQTVYPLWCPSLTKDMQTEQLLCWSVMTDTEHSKTSSSNEEDISWRLSNANYFPSLQSFVFIFRIN